MLTSTISTLCYLDDWWTTHIVSLYLSRILNRNYFTSWSKDSQNICLIDVKEILDDFCTCSHFVTQRIKWPLCKTYTRWMRDIKKAIILSQFCSKGYWCLKRKKGNQISSSLPGNVGIQRNEFLRARIFLAKRNIICHWLYQKIKWKSLVHHKTVINKWSIWTVS